MGKRELLVALQNVAQLLAESKKMHEGGYFEAHEKASTAATQLQIIICDVAEMAAA